MTEDKNLSEEHLTDDMFEFVELDEKKSEVISAPEYSYWGSVFRKFFSSKVAITMLIVLGLVMAMSFIHPIFSGYDNTNYENINNPELRFIRPNLEYPFGTDSAGRNVFNMVWAGARTSLI
ncbi:peptide ABC transporter permease, partial [Rhodovulum adriaticum]|nr:peptide ABC transporter permease [Rhodovulum adriaticum]